MVEETNQHQFIKFISRPLFFLSMIFFAYLLSLHCWAFPLVPFFLLLLKEDESLPYGSLGFILLLQDVAWGCWLGTHLFLYGGVSFFIIGYKRFFLSRGFFLIWCFFILLTSILISLRYFLGILSGVSPYPFLRLFYEVAFLSCFFPLCYHFLLTYLRIRKRAAHDL